MTRVHQAFERARAIGAENKVPSRVFQANRDVLGLWDFADTDRGEVREVPSRPVVESRREAAPAIGPVMETRYSGDQGAHRHVRRSWIRRMFSLSYLRRAQSGSNGDMSGQRRADVFSTFLPTSDGRDFQELIRDLARAEKEETR